MNLKKQHGYSALHFACDVGSDKKQNHVKCIDSLIQAGADVNSTSFTGITPLMIAAGCKSDDNCVNALILAGADVNVSDRYSETPLAIAIRKGAEKNVKLLIEAGASLSTVAGGQLPPLLLAIKRDKYVRLLINSGANVNYVPDWYDSWPPLTYAVFHGHAKSVELLLQAGANVNRTDRGQKTALHRVKNVQCLCLLLKARAHVNMKPVNALEYKIANKPTKDVCMMMFAAGERLKYTTVVITHATGREDEAQVPDYLLFKDVKFHLKHLCREKIRKHLLDMDPHTNMFLRVPHLPLPNLLINYLLYNLFLETDSDNDDDDDNNSKTSML